MQHISTFRLHFSVYFVYISLCFVYLSIRYINTNFQCKSVKSVVEHSVASDQVCGVGFEANIKRKSEVPKRHAKVVHRHSQALNIPVGVLPRSLTQQGMRVTQQGMCELLGVQVTQASGLSEMPNECPNRMCSVLFTAVVLSNLWNFRVKDFQSRGSRNTEALETNERDFSKEKVQTTR